MNLIAPRVLLCLAYDDLLTLSSDVTGVDMDIVSSARFHLVQLSVCPSICRSVGLSVHPLVGLSVPWCLRLSSFLSVCQWVVVWMETLVGTSETSQV